MGFDRKYNLSKDMKRLRQKSPSSLQEEFRDLDKNINVDIPYVSDDLPRDLCLSLEIALFDLFANGLEEFREKFVDVKFDGKRECFLHHGERSVKDILESFLQ